MVSCQTLFGRLVLDSDNGPNLRLQDRTAGYLHVLGQVLERWFLCQASSKTPATAPSTTVPSPEPLSGAREPSAVVSGPPADHYATLTLWTKACPLAIGSALYPSKGFTRGPNKAATVIER